MPTSLHSAYFGRPVVAALRSSAISGKPPAAHSHPQPFITIARQAGAGGLALAEQLVSALNSEKRCQEPFSPQDTSDASRPWKYYDKQLIEKVAADFHLPRSLVASLPEHPHSFVEDLAQGICLTGSRPSDDSVYRKIIATIRTLASLGRVVIVGRGGAFCTQDLPAGIHINLIASLQDRIQRTADIYRIPLQQAAAKVAQIDSNRDAFYHRFWPNSSRSPESFTLTVNTSTIPTPQLTQLIHNLLQTRSPV